MTLDNHARASRALASLRAYSKAARLPHQLTNERIGDLITDLLHLAVRLGATAQAVDDIVNLAHLQHRSETAQPIPAPAPSARPYNPERSCTLQ